MSRFEAGPEVGIVLPIEVDGLKDHCGVWATWDLDNQNILRDANIGALNIQHRGEGGAGVAVISRGSEEIDCIRGSGKVREVFGENAEILHNGLPEDSFAAIVHTRWPTDGAPGDWNQPRWGSEIAVGHNGQLTNKDSLAEMFGVSGEGSDTDVMTMAIDKVAMQLGGDVERAVVTVLPHLEGAFCLTILAKDKLIAVRDRHGMRPLQLGTTETGGYIVASENMAIDNVSGARWEREIEPAEMVVVDKNGLRSGRWAPPESELEQTDTSLHWAEPDPAACIIEHVYLANKGTMLNGIRIGESRRGFGAQLPKRILPHIREKITALIPLPNGANQVTHGTAEASGIPFVPLLQINPDVEYGRSFIQPDRATQSGMADGKLRVDPDLAPELLAMVVDQEVAEEDDSLIRSTTQKANIPRIRAAGAKAVHVLVASAQYVGTCDLGVDTPDPKDLIAVRHNGDEAKIAAEIGADSVTYLELEDMYQVVGRKVCSSCLGGQLPNPIARTAVDKRFRELAEELEPTLEHRPIPA